VADHQLLQERWLKRRADPAGTLAESPGYESPATAPAFSGARMNDQAAGENLTGAHDIIVIGRFGGGLGALRALWQIPGGGMLRYRCHVGHAFTAETALSALDGEVDNMLESTLRSHQQRAALAHRMAEQERGRNRESLAGQVEGWGTQARGRVPNRFGGWSGAMKIGPQPWPWRPKGAR